MFSEFSDGGTIGGGLNGGIGFSGWATRWWMASLPLFHRTMIDLPRAMECVEPSALISLACCCLLIPSPLAMSHQLIPFVLSFFTTNREATPPETAAPNATMKC